MDNHQKVTKLLLAAKKYISVYLDIPAAYKADFRCHLFETDDFHDFKKVDKLWDVVANKKATETQLVNAIAGVISGYTSRAKAFYVVKWNFGPGYVPIKIKAIPATVVKSAATNIYNSVLDKAA